jgi:hypothetical protein
MLRGSQARLLFGLGDFSVQVDVDHSAEILFG